MIEIKKLAYVVPLLVLFSNTNTMNFFRQYNQDRGHIVTVNTFGQYGSNAITSDFTYSFLTGQYLDNGTKDPVRDKLGEYNRFGADWVTEVSYLNLNDSALGKNWGYYLGVKNRMYADVKFNSNLFNLIFYGNKQYAGQTVEFGGSSANYVMYQQFQVGFVKQMFHKKDVHTLGFGVSFLNGNNRNTANINQGTLYTDSTGNHLDLTTSLAVQRTATTHTHFLANNGSGLSFDFFYEGSLGENSTISLSVNDLGFINWDRPGNEAVIDSTMNFEGIEIQNIVTTNGSEFNDFVDSIDQYYIRTNNRHYGLMGLPANMNLAYTHAFLDRRIMVQGGIQLRALDSFVPLIFARGIFYPHRRVMLGTMIGYGGYTTLNVGFDFGVDFGKGYIIQLSTRNLEGAVPNTFGTAISAGFKFSKMF